MTKYSELTSKRQVMADLVPLSTPFGIWIDPSNYCNFKCSFCPRNLDTFHDYAGKFMHMDFSLFEKIVSDIKQFQNRIKVIRLYYLGEPLLNPRFVDFLQLLMDASVTERIEITTNASMLSEEKSAAILSVAANHPDTQLFMRYSIYSVLPERNKRITSNPVDVAQIRRNIEVFQSLRDKMHVNNVSTYAKMLDTFDESENKTFFDFYQSIVDDIQLEEPMNWSGDDAVNLLEKEYGDRLPDNAFKTRVKEPCQYPFNSLAVNPDGSVVVCCVDWSRKTQVGNVAKTSLLEIWNGKQLRDLQLLHLAGRRCENDACRNCLRLPVFQPGHENDSLKGITPEEFLKRLGKD